MKRISLLFSLSFLLFATTFAQKHTLKTVYGTNPVKIVMPLMIDSINLKREKFTKRTLLNTAFSISEQEAFVNVYQADTNGYFFLPQPNKDATFQLFSFYVNSDRYAKGTLNVYSPNLFEIYVDGKLEKLKLKSDLSLSEVDATSISLKPYPISQRVVIKLLAFSDDSIAPALKLQWENDKADSLAHFTFTHDTQRKLNFTDMLLGTRVSSVAISSQGNYALIRYRTGTGDENHYFTELYNVKKNNRIVIDQNGSKYHLNWMPQSEKLYYLQKIDDLYRIVIIDPTTLEERVLVKNIPNIVKPYFTSDEQRFFYIKDEKIENDKNDLRRIESVPARLPDYTIRRFANMYDIESGFATQLTFGTESVRIVDISHDGQKLLLSYSRENITERPFSKQTMLLLNIETMQADTLWHDEPFLTSASFSPDDKKVVITGSAEALGGIGNNLPQGDIPNSYHILAYIMDLETKAIECITKDFNPSIERCFWNSGDNLLYLHTSDRDCSTVYTYNSETEKMTKLPLKEEVVSSFSIANNALTAIYYGVSLKNSTRAYLYDLKSRKSTMIADPYQERLEEIRLGEIHDWNFTNSAGVTIEGRYYLPPDFDSTRQYPMIVYYYGGAMPTTRTFEHPYPGHLFASQGYVTYVIQPSGTIGYGQEFAALHVNAWGKRTSEDIMEGTEKFLKEHRFVNREKVGCIGASYGGFMTMYLLTKTDLFAAAVSHAGISDITSYWGEGYWGYAYSSVASAGSYPWNNKELYVDQSPLFSADKINTPLLLTHGMEDTNVPIGESIQMFTALKILGKPVEFIQVKGENHGVMKYTRRVAWNNSIMAWFDKWLKDDSRRWSDIYPE